MIVKINKINKQGMNMQFGKSSRKRIKSRYAGKNQKEKRNKQLK